MKSNFVRFGDETGTTVYVNPSAVAYIVENRYSDGCRIVFGDCSLDVAEDAKTVVEELEQKEAHNHAEPR